MSTRDAAHCDIYVHTPTYLMVNAYVFDSHNNVTVTVSNGDGLTQGFKLPADQAEELGRGLIELAAKARANDQARRSAEAAAQAPAPQRQPVAA